VLGRWRLTLPSSGPAYGGPLKSNVRRQNLTMAQPHRPKFVASLTFRGFDVLPSEVESLIGVKATSLGTQGSPRRPGTTPLQRSFAQWAIEFPDSARLDEMIPAILNSIGGPDHLAKARSTVKPEFLEVDLTLRIKDSEHQEGGFIDRSTIEMLAKFGATLSFGFCARDDA